MKGQIDKTLVLITAYRRESFSKGFFNLCEAISKLAERFNNTAFVYPVYLNPNVRALVFRLLGEMDNVYLIEPLTYLPFNPYGDGKACQRILAALER